MTDGRYQIDDTPIATGGQGEVYFGIDPKGRKIAVKVAAESKVAEEALIRELEIVRHMNDAGVKGVVPCLAELKVRGRRAMVMPRYPEHMGEWLKRAILEPTPKTLRELLTYHAQLARVLSSVHGVYYDGGTVVHRDIKPENVFLDGRGGVWLGDFGGAMAIEEIKSVELAMFGTPMWAPLDQLLPGRAIPDTTWDTYAICVLLYAAVTGARPAYQSDPRELLTPAGQALWQAARTAVEASGGARQDAHRRFAVMRKGTRASDLVDLTGRAALVNGDKEALTKGLRRLCHLAKVDEAIERSLSRGLWNLLVRGLSPLSHPSPPNRYRDAAELAETIEELLERLGPERRSQDLSELVGGSTALESPARRTTLSSSPPIVAVAGIAVLGVLAVIGLFFAWPTLSTIWRVSTPLPVTVDVPGGPVALGSRTVAVQPFTLDVTEVSVANYMACVGEGACTPVPFSSANDQPAIGLGIAEADAVCAYRGGWVPSEAQWLLAHGPERFPWGEAGPTCDHAIAMGCGSAVSDVGTARLGASRVGAVDMAGNAWEWVKGVEGPALVGGALNSPARELGSAGRQTPAEGTRPSLAGVRCVYESGKGPR